MWNKQVSIKTNATKKQVWKLWSDVENWKKWDIETEYSSLEGSFEVGQYITIKPVGAPKSKCKIIEVSENKNFTVCASLPFTKMYFIHELEELNGELFITHRVEIKGLLTFLFSKIIGKNLEKNLTKSMNNLSDMAEKV